MGEREDIMITAISQALLYISFSILVGSLLVSIIPKKKLPGIVVSKSLVLVSILSIPFLSFFPIYELVQQLQVSLEMSFVPLLVQILFTFTVGKAWLWTLGLSLILFFLMFNPKASYVKFFQYVSLFATFCLVLAHGKASHAASLNDWAGFISQSTHFLAVTIWIGLLLVTGWFTKDSRNWISFLRWFTPLAILCVTATILSGFIMMRYVVPEYYNSWMLTYGQALLLKHLFILPILTFAFVNSFLIKRKLQSDNNFNPIKWYKTESVIALFIFATTAFMSQQTPPHEVARTLTHVEPSFLFQALYKGDFDPALSISLSFNTVSLILLSIALLFLLMIIVTYIQKWRVSYTLLFSISFVIFSYLALMNAIVGTIAPSNLKTFQTVEAAIQANHPNESIRIYQQKELDTQTDAVIYSLNHQQIAYSQLYKQETGFSLFPFSTLIIPGSLSLDDVEHKVRTFKVINSASASLSPINSTEVVSYITFGYLDQVIKASTVQIEFEDNLDTVPIHNQVFLSIVHSEEELSTSPPIQFFSSTGDLVGSFMSQNGGFTCH
jgi:putative copper export protein